MGRLREYHYEVSQPRRNPSDNHYYQRVRQVDAEGRLTAFGERIFKSTYVFRNIRGLQVLAGHRSPLGACS